MPKDKIQKYVITFSVFLFAVTSIGYLFAPAKMLSVVGIVSTFEMDFLIRTLAIALLALIPSVWAVRNRDNSSTQRAVLIGLAGYMFLSSAVDFHAYLQHIVGVVSVPSVIFRVVLSAIIFWLIQRK